MILSFDAHLHTPMGCGGEEVQVNVKVRRIFFFDWNFYFFNMREFFKMEKVLDNQ